MLLISFFLIMYCLLVIIIFVYCRVFLFLRSKIFFWDKLKENVIESMLFVIFVLMLEFIKRKILLFDNLIFILFFFLKFLVLSSFICNIILFMNFGILIMCIDWELVFFLISIFCGFVSCCMMWEYFLDVSGVDFMLICFINCLM